MFSKKTWFRIEYDHRSGWVYSADLILSLYRQRKQFALISLSYASMRETSANANPTSSSMADENSSLPENTNTYFLIIAFLGILLGMLGKVAYDEVDEAKKICFKSCFQLRKCIKAFIVAPIVFLGFLFSGKLVLIDITSYAVSVLFAFQNGFFWQTVLPTKVQEA